MDIYDLSDKCVDEILSEDVWHQLVYDAGPSVTVAVTDRDRDGLPLGFFVDVATPATSVSASLRLTVDHYGRFGFKFQGRSEESDTRRPGGLTNSCPGRSIAKPSIQFTAETRMITW